MIEIILETLELLELYETTHIVEKNLRGNMAIPKPCIGLLKGRSQTLTSSFFLCLRVVSVLLRKLMNTIDALLCGNLPNAVSPWMFVHHF